MLKFKKNKEMMIKMEKVKVMKILKVCSKNLEKRKKINQFKKQLEQDKKQKIKSVTPKRNIKVKSKN